LVSVREMIENICFKLDDTEAVGDTHCRMSL
jgi:hypothetical protein